MTANWTEKYRPHTFSQVIGQPAATQVLSKDVNNPHGTYIFHGKFGAGKTTSARIFAAALNCTSKKEGDTEPCGTCVSCSTIFSGKQSTSVVEMNASEHNSVSDAREIINNLDMAVVGRKKVYILDECHNASKQFWDTLLHDLESPPEDVHFILVTTEVNKIRPTVVSRSRKVIFKPIDDETMSQHLQSILDQEELSVDQEGIESAVVAGGGSVRSAIKALEDVVDGVGVAGSNTWSLFVSAVEKKDIPQVLMLSNQLFEEGIVSPAASVERMFEELAEQSQKTNWSEWTLSDMIFAMKELSKAVTVMSSSGSQKVAAQASFVSMISPPHIDVAGIVTRDMMNVIAQEVNKAVTQVVSTMSNTVPAQSVSNEVEDVWGYNESFSGNWLEDIASDEEKQEEDYNETHSDEEPESEQTESIDVDAWLDKVGEKFKADEEEVKKVKKNSPSILSIEKKLPQTNEELKSFLKTLMNKAQLNGKEFSSIVDCCDSSFDAEFGEDKLVIMVDGESVEKESVKDANSKINELIDDECIFVWEQ